MIRRQIEEQAQKWSPNPMLTDSARIEGARASGPEVARHFGGLARSLLEGPAKFTLCKSRSTANRDRKTIDLSSPDSEIDL